MAVLGQEITRRRFGFLLPTTVLLSQTSQSHAILVPDRLVWDGEVWKADSLSMKMGYVVGFLDAAASALANIETELTELKSLSAEDRDTLASGKAIFDYARIDFSRLLEEMNDFYANPLNSAITWDHALSYARDKIQGKPQDYLVRQLELERRLTSTSPENK